MPNPLWDALTEVCGVDANGLTKTARAGVGKVVGELTAVGATPEQVRERAGRYRERWPRMSLTPTALAKHWASLGSESTPVVRANGVRQHHSALTADEVAMARRGKS